MHARRDARVDGTLHIRLHVRAHLGELGRRSGRGHTAGRRLLTGHEGEADEKVMIRMIKGVVMAVRTAYRSRNGYPEQMARKLAARVVCD